MTRTYRPFGRNFLLSSIAAACILLSAYPVAADTPGSGAPEATSTDLTEIVVTAERRDESLLKVPMSLTAMSQKTMDELHVQSFSDLATIVPGLVVPTPEGGFQSGTNVAIRGIISENNSATTAVYIDETPIVVRQNTSIGFNGTPQPDIFDLERVEVLRGPQGTLFGASAMGGAIRYITPQPNLDTSSGYAKAEFSYTDRGSPNDQVGVAYGAPIIQGIAAFRLSGWFHSEGGFIDVEDPYTGQILNRNSNSSGGYVLRPAFTIAPVEGLTITPAFYIQHKESAAPPVYWVTEMPHPEAGAFVTGFGATTADPMRDDLSVSSLAIKYDFASMSLQSDTSFLDRRFRSVDDWSNLVGPLIGVPPLTPSLPAFSSDSTNVTNTRAWQQELRLTSRDADSRFTWVVGAYYRRALDQLSQAVTPDLSPLTQLIYGETSLQLFGIPNYVLNGQVLNAYSQFITVTEEAAAFADADFAITSRLKASAGVRLERSALDQQHQVIGGPLDGFADLHATLPDEVEKPVTPRYGLTYQYTDQDMVYVTAAKGYRIGGSNSPIVTENPFCEPSASALGITVPSTYKSDSLWSYEVGAKDSFLDHRFSLEASVFYIIWSNIQTVVELPSCSNSVTTNRGKAVSQGFDLQFAAVPMQGLTLGGNVAYTDTYQPNAQYSAPVNGVTALLNGAGDKLEYVVPWTASIYADYSPNIRLPWGARPYMRIDYRWLDASNKQDPAVAAYDPSTGAVIGNSGPTPAYSTLNLRFGVVHEGLDLSLFVNNATNSHPILGYYHITMGDPLYSATAIRPLTAGITALYHF